MLRLQPSSRIIRLFSLLIAIVLSTVAVMGQQAVIWVGDVGNWFPSPSNWYCVPQGVHCGPPSGPGWDVNIGDSGISGTVFLNAPVFVDQVALGVAGVGILNVSGSNTLTTLVTIVGNSGGFGSSGTLNTTGGGLVSDTTGYIGALSGSVGFVNVSGPGSQWINSGSQSLYIGDYGQGTLTINSGGVVNSNSAILGYQSGSSGTVTVSGAGSQWNDTGAFPSIGYGGQATLTVNGGGVVNITVANLAELNGSSATVVVTGAGSQLNSGYINVGIRGPGMLMIQSGGSVSGGPVISIGVGNSGTVTVDGIGSELNSSGALAVGFTGPGTLTVQNGAVSSSSATLIGNYGSLGTATVDGIGSQLNSSGALDVGAGGPGTLTVQNGGAASTNYLYVGLGAQGTLTLQNGGAVSTSNLYVGQDAQGILTVQNGGMVTSAVAQLGQNAGGVGTVTVMDPGSQWSNTGSLTIGGNGQGTLTIQDGGLVTSAGAQLGQNGGGVGTVTIMDPGSQWSNTGSLTIGGNGQGTLTIQNGGVVHNGSGSFLGGFALENRGFLDVEGASSLQVSGGVDNSGFISTNNFGGGGNSILSIAGTLTNEPTGGVALFSPGDAMIVGQLINNGGITVSLGATLNLTGQPNGVTDITAGSQFELAGTFTAGANNGFYQLTSVEGTLILDNAQVTGNTPTGGTLTVSSSGDLAIDSGSSLQVTGNLDNAGFVESGLDVTAPNFLTVTGAFTNSPGAFFEVGHYTGSSDLAKVGSLVNGGYVHVYPGATLNLTNQPSGITDVVAGSVFFLKGSFNAGANNGLYQLTGVEGALFLANGQVTDDTPIGGTLTVSTTGAIHIDNNSTLQVFGNIDNYGYIGQDPSTLIVTGTLTNEVGSTFNLTAGDVLQAGNIVNKGAFDIPSGATIQTAYYLSSAQTTLNPQATLLVGTGTAGNTGYYQLANGTLGEFIDMSGFGVIVVNGPVHLDGTLDVQLASGFNPQVGSTYDFITFAPGGYDGSIFASILNGVFNNGTEKWVVVYNNFGGYIELMAQANNQPTPEPASFLLFGTGLVGLSYGIRRRRSSR